VSFKIVTGAVVAAVGWEGLYFLPAAPGGEGRRLRRNEARRDRRRHHGQHPVRPDRSLHGTRGDDREARHGDAERREATPDTAWELNRMGRAKEKYIDAWVLTPAPSGAEAGPRLFLQRDERPRRAWWKRHLKSSPARAPRSPFNTVMPHGE